MIDRVVDAALDEGALAPVHHLAAGADVEFVAAEIPAPVDERVEQPRRRNRPGPCPLRRSACVRSSSPRPRRRAAPSRARKGRSCRAIERELRDDLERVRDAALAVVEVAVVDVRRAAGAAVGRADQPRVAALLATGLAEGQRRVEAAVPAAGGEVDRLGSARREDRRDERGQRAQESVLVMWFPRARTGRKFAQGYISGLGFALQNGVADQLWVTCRMLLRICSESTMRASSATASSASS